MTSPDDIRTEFVNLWVREIVPVLGVTTLVVVPLIWPLAAA